MLSKSNFLILDEPTNHLDIVSKEILEEAIRKYTGTVLYVSHDRYFINQTATRILELKNHAIVNYIGNYDYYLEKSEELTQIYAPEQSGETAVLSASASSSSRNGRVKRTGEERKRQNDLKKWKMRSEAGSRSSEIDERMTRKRFIPT
ncbi:MAG: hypothetical protein ACLU3N_03660 [Lachnospiraceae bacterium]